MIPLGKGTPYDEQKRESRTDRKNGKMSRNSDICETRHPSVASRNILTDERGASVLYALLFLLVAIMVSVTVINAAVTTAHRVSDDKAWKQERLTLDSAGDVMVGMLRNTTFTVRTTSPGGAFEEAEVLEKDGPLADILEPAVIATAQHHMGVIDDPDSFEIEADGFDKVTVSYEMDSEEVDIITGETHPQDRYRITAILQTEDGEQRLFVEAYQSNAAPVETTQDEGETTITETIQWSDIKTGTRLSEEE